MGRALGLILELVAGAAHAGAAGVAALNHEIGNHAVENRAAVERPRALLAADVVFPVAFALGQVNEVLHCFWCILLEKTAGDVAFAGLKYGVCSRLTSHIASLTQRRFLIGRPSVVSSGIHSEYNLASTSKLLPV